MDWEDRPPAQTSLLPEDAGQNDAEPDPILRALALEEKTLEELIQETGLSAAELGTKLTLLEIGGRIERRPGRAFALVRS